jgi:4-amino-4-deoxy-L-arabinose transferase-like glycosyltransferase
MLIGIIGAFLWLPLADVLSFPNRVAVLPNLEADAAAYDAFAWDFARSWQIDALPTKHPPGWMALLAGVYAIAGHSYVVGKLVSWVALVATVALCAWTADRMYGRRAAAIAALLCASSPGLRAYVGTLQYEVVTAAWFMLLVVLAARVTETAGARTILSRAAVAGVAGAALVLTRETFAPVVMLAALWIWSRLRGHPRRLVSVGFFIAAAAAPPVIWSAVQTVQHDRLIVVAEKGPKEFRLGNNPLANGTYNEPLVGMAEPSGVEFIRRHPDRAAELVLRKGLYMFGVLRDGWMAPHPPSVWLWRASTGVLPLSLIDPVVRGGWLLAACAIALYAFGAERWRAWWIVPASVAAILAEHMVTLGSFRFGVPLLPALYVISSGPLDRAAQAVVSGLRIPLVAAGCALIVALSFVAQFRSWPLIVEYRAVDLEGLAASNEVDERSREFVRVADARRGVRPVVLLPDTYLPRGSLRVMVTLRPWNAANGTPIARIALTHLDGTPACAEDVDGSLPSERFSEFSVQCRLKRDGPATLAIFSLGQVDMSVGNVRLAWGAGRDRSPE